MDSITFSKTTVKSNLSVAAGPKLASNSGRVPLTSMSSCPTSNGLMQEFEESCENSFDNNV